LSRFITISEWISRPVFRNCRKKAKLHIQDNRYPAKLASDLLQLKEGNHITRLIMNINRA
jgi:hypothetical protein